MIALAPALLLFSVAIAAWFVALGARAAARLQIRFAAVLFAALAVAGPAMPAAAGAVALLVLPIGLGVLALAGFAGFARALPPSLAAGLLGLICLCALGAAVSGLGALALAPAALAAAAIFVVSARQFDAARLSSLQGMLSALCFVAAASAFALDGAGTALDLFSAAGLLGLALALSRSDVVAEEGAGRDLRAIAAIGGRRQT